MGSCHIVVVHINRTLELVFFFFFFFLGGGGGGEGIREIWQCVLLVNRSHISELDVRLLNFSIWTSVD